MAREIKSANDDVQLLNIANENTEPFKDRLVKLIPSEIVTAYITIQGLLKGNTATTGKTDILLWIIISILLALTPIYLMKVSGVKKRAQIIFTTIAFMLWVIVIGSPIKIILGFDSAFFGSIMLVLYTLIIPFVYKG